MKLQFKIQLYFAIGLLVFLLALINVACSARANTLPAQEYEFSDAVSDTTSVPVKKDDPIVADLPMPNGQDPLPVYQGSRGGLYCKRISGKTGNPYRMYLTDKQKLIMIPR